MSTHSLIIKAGTRIVPKGLQEADLTVVDGRMTKLAAEFEGKDSDIIVEHLERINESERCTLG